MKNAEIYKIQLKIVLIILNVKKQGSISVTHRKFLNVQNAILRLSTI